MHVLSTHIIKFDLNEWKPTTISKNVKRLYNYEFINKSITLINTQPKQIGPANKPNERQRIIQLAARQVVKKIITRNWNLQLTLFSYCVWMRLILFNIFFNEIQDEAVNDNMTYLLNFLHSVCFLPESTSQETSVSDLSWIRKFQNLTTNLEYYSSLIRLHWQQKIIKCPFWDHEWPDSRK